MTDYISRADAIEELTKLPTDTIHSHFDDGYSLGIKHAIRTITTLPSADAEQVTSKLKSVEISTDKGDKSTMSQPNGKLDLISRADAIEAVRGLSALVDDKDFHYFENVINALPSAELTLQTPQTYGKSINPSNAEVVEDYISRADVHKTLSLLATEGGTDAKMLLMDAHEFIDALPSADRPIRLYEEGAIELLRMTGWLTEHDKEIGRPQGEWINNEHDIPVCSECGYFTPYDRAIDDYEYGNFCPNCGARMKGGDE